jgi:hypothetical protein
MAKEYPVPAALSTILSWRWLRLVIMQIKHETGDTHTAIKLVLDALRRGKVFARGLYRGEREARPITDWNHLTIEVDRDSEDMYAVRWLDARHGSEPAVTNIIILRGEKNWNAFWPQDAAPEQKASWQRDRVKTALKKLYPPNGVVSKDFPIVAVHRKVCDELKPDSRARGLGDPSIDTVTRAIGRRK